MPGAIDAVVFDWGGTLSVHAGIDLADMWRMTARHLAPDRENEVCAVLTAVEQSTWDRVAVDQHAFKLTEILDMASEELSLDVTEAVLEEAATHHLDSWTPHIQHDPDAVPVLAALQEGGYRVGLLSNTHWPRTFHEHFLDRDGLAELIDIRCYTSELRHTKPHPEAFRAVLRALGGTDPRRAVFVGDRLYDDVFGARAMGMKAVHRRNPLVPSHDTVPDATIDSLPELLPLVASWS